MKSKLFLMLGLLPLLLVLTLCTNGQRKKLTGSNIKLFEDTPVWKLAQAVEKQDTAEIKEIIANEPELNVDYQDPQLGFSLLIWSVYNNRYYSAKQLLKYGAKPNLKESYSGTSSVMHAADNHDTSDYLRLVLKYEGDPNAVADSVMSYRVGTPLIAAASTRLESVKILVEDGADIDYIFDNKRSALLSAMMAEKAEIVRYLLIEKGAKFYEPPKYSQGRPFIRWLRGWVFPLDSEEYKIKMEIVNFLNDNGYNYSETEIPKTVKEHYSKEYWSKY